MITFTISYHGMLAIMLLLLPFSFGIIRGDTRNRGAPQIPRRR